jgi:hypothetical protein
MSLQQMEKLAELHQRLSETIELLAFLSRENKHFREKILDVEENYVILPKKQAMLLVKDVECILEYVRKEVANNGSISWEDVLGDIGFDVYNGIKVIKSQLGSS